MSALAANKNYDKQDGKLISLKVAASQHIYQGAIVKTSSGYLKPMAAEASAKFAGIAVEECDNSSGSKGDKECRVETEGVFPMVTSGAAQGDVLKTVYASDDQTVSTTQGSNEIAVGKIVRVESATLVYVKINAALA